MLKIKNVAKKIYIEAEVADNLWKRMLGLSFSKRRNMFFPLPFEGRWSLWMFAVGYHLKMIFIDSDKTVIDIKEAEPLSFNPKTWKIYKPKKSCKYILETPYNLKVKIGDKLVWKNKFEKVEKLMQKEEKEIEKGFKRIARKRR